LIFRNRTDDAHPLHLHRHVFELVEIYGKRTAGIIKDTVVVPAYGRRRSTWWQTSRPVAVSLPHPTAHGFWV